MFCYGSVPHSLRAETLIWNLKTVSPEIIDYVEMKVIPRYASRHSRIQPLAEYNRQMALSWTHVHQRRYG